MRPDLRRVRPAELLALLAAVVAAVALFLPWYEFGGVRRDAWNALTVAEIPVALAAVLAFALVTATAYQRSPSLPVSLAVWTTSVALIATIAIAVRALAPPAGAAERCYGLWLALAAVVGIVIAGWGSMSDERPYWSARPGGGSPA